MTYVKAAARLRKTGQHGSFIMGQQNQIITVTDVCKQFSSSSSGNAITALDRIPNQRFPRSEYNIANRPLFNRKIKLPEDLT